MDAIRFSPIPSFDVVKERIAESSEMRKISGSVVVAASSMSQSVEIEHCALTGPGTQWVVDLLCHASNGARDICSNLLWESLTGRYPGAKVEVKHNAVAVTLPPIEEDLEVAAFGTPGKNDVIRKQIAIFGPKPEKGKNWVINIFLYDDTLVAFQQLRQKERERGNKLLTARAGLFVANIEEDINIELSPLQPGWRIEGSKVKVIQSSEAWKMPENGTEFPCCICDIKHVDETKELFICGITVSQREEATKAEVVAMFKQVDRKEIDEMKLGENIVITLPSCSTSSMKGDNITLMNENKEEIRKLLIIIAQAMNLITQRTTEAFSNSYCWKVTQGAGLTVIMSDNIPLNSQGLYTEDELYNLDVFSYVRPPIFGTEGSLNQLVMDIMRTKENCWRLALIQEQNAQRKIEGYSNSFRGRKPKALNLLPNW